MDRIITRRAVHAQPLNSTLHPVLQRIYQARGITDPALLEYRLDCLVPYRDLMGIEKAIDCLVHAIQNQQRIMIIGDFDADGATSTALMVSGLNALGAEQVSYLVPNRFDYGYGLTPEIVAMAKKKADPHLLITVDNGISSCDGVDAANAAGMQVIITDHHLPGDTLPKSAAIVNPNQTGDRFPSKCLAGVGVAFYVLLALRHGLRRCHWFASNDEPNMAQFLDLVALGTIADLVPLDYVNRILVQQGLLRINAGKVRSGIKALLAIAKRHHTQVVASDLSYAIAPRLNAAGRLDDMSLGIDCLLEHDYEKAMQLAQQLDQLNHMRRDIELEMKTQAFNHLLVLKKGLQAIPKGLCLFDATWHQGVVGILASRLKEEFHRPTIVFATSQTNGELKGSGRSIPGLHLRDLLDRIATKQSGLITKFGGHAMAAGLSLPKANLARFKQAYLNALDDCLDPQLLVNEILSDGSLPVEDFTLNFAKQLRFAGPWGQHFPKPLFDDTFYLLTQRLVGTHHLKLVLVVPETGQQIDAIAFHIDLNQWPNHRCQKIHAAYYLDVNEFNGLQKLQLIIDYLKPL